MIVRVNVNDNIRRVTADTVINALNGVILSLGLQPEELYHISAITVKSKVKAAT